MSKPAFRPWRTVGAVVLGAFLFPLACLGALVLIFIVCETTGALDQTYDTRWAGVWYGLLAIYAVVLVGPVVGGLIGYFRARRARAASAPPNPPPPPPPTPPAQ